MGRLRVGVVVLGVIAMLGVGARSAHAAPFLLSQDNEEKLEAWLGQGDLTFTNIFEKTVGSSAYDFHIAADGKGATFTLLEAIYQGTPYIIGGYNPQSWRSDESVSLTSADADRTAFLYNLTTGTRLNQRLSTDPFSAGYGATQTVNYFYEGPTFGNGFDLYLPFNLSYGFARQYSYGPGNPCGVYGTSVLGVALVGEDCNWIGSDRSSFLVGALEVYTFAPAEIMPAAVPEPATLGLLAVGLAAIGVRRWKQVR